MANPFGEKNIGPWEGQQVEYIPLDDLVLWTENPRDPLDGDYTNNDVIRRATDGRNDKQWQLSKLSKEMGDRFDLSELPTVCRIDDGPKYRVYDGNRRVILAMLRKAGLTTEGQQQLVPPDFPDPSHATCATKRPRWRMWNANTEVTGAGNSTSGTVSCSTTGEARKPFSYGWRSSSRR